MNRFCRDFALVRENGSVVWQSNDAARLQVIRLELLEEGIKTRVVASDLPRSRAADR
jgi:hypothetical protein